MCAASRASDQSPSSHPNPEKRPGAPFAHTPGRSLCGNYFVVVVVVVAWALAGFLAGAGVVAGIGFAGAVAGAADLDVFTGVRIAALFRTGWVAGRAGVPAFGLAFTIRCC